MWFARSSSLIPWVLREPESHLFVGAHHEEIGHESGETRSERRLGDEAQLHLSETDDLVLTAPRRQVHQKSLRSTDEECYKCDTIFFAGIYTLLISLTLFW